MSDTIPLSIIDEDMGDDSPSIGYVFGGRLNSSEYVKITNEKNQTEDVHKVHLDLVLTNEQYRQLLSTIGTANPIKVLLV